jgi:hypothetical protein
MIKFDKPECPLCGEELQLNKNGHFFNKENTRVISIYFCIECDQSYGMQNGQLALAPFDSAMKPIKIICKTCGKEENYRQKAVALLNENGSYDLYCTDCSIEFLRNWARSLSKENYPKSMQNHQMTMIDATSVHEFYGLYETITMNKIFSNPKSIERMMKEAWSEENKRALRGVKTDISKHTERVKTRLERMNKHGKSKAKN